MQKQMHLFLLHKKTTHIKESCFFDFKQLDVQNSENVFLSNHKHKVQNPDNPSAENSDNCSNDFSFLESCNNTQKPSCEWDDCKNQAYNVTQTKVIRFFCHCTLSFFKICNFVTFSF